MPLIQSGMLCGSGRPVALPLPLITLFLIALLSTSGSQQLVLSKTINRAAQLALEPSNNVTKIAFASDRDGNFEIYVMDADGGGQIRLTVNPGEDHQPSWSPDGNRIAFVSTRDGNAEIYVMNNDGSNQTRLTNNAADDLSPTWSPAGDLIAFVSGRDGNDEIYLMNVDGSNQRNLTVHGADDSSLSFSPDGMTIVFSSSREDSRFNLYQMNVDGSMVTRLTSTEGDDINPAQSIQRFTFQSNRDANEEIYALDIQTGNQSRLTNNSDLDIDPTQQPGGGNICFATNRDGNLEIYLMEPDGGNLRRLTSNSAADIQPALQPTGVVPTPPGSGDAIIQFSVDNYSVGEGETRATLAVTRTGNTDATSAVDFLSVEGDASSRSDFVFRTGTLTFNPGETQKSLNVLIIDDVFLEHDETFTVTLSNPKGAALGTLNTATVTIRDNDTASNQPNPINNARFFVNQHYFDFLNREPDSAGLDFWTNEITSCGSNFACLIVRRINVSAAFYLSIEFTETGYLVYRIYKVAYGNLQGAPVPLRLNEFLPDTQEIGRGVVVGVGDWQEQLENNQNAFLTSFVMRGRFAATYPETLTPAQFVDTLNQNASNILSQAERDQLVNDLSTGIRSRAQVLRAIAEDADLVQKEFNSAFVLMQYFGYLRRNPDDAPDMDFAGYNFWLNKLNEFNGNFVNAEMVKAFIESSEYMKRFGP